MSDTQVVRCPWGDSPDPLMRDYHDGEWGHPCHDDTALFELMSLELMQAGLSWRCVLHKRQALRRAFHGFDPQVVAGMQDEVEALLQDVSIIRNRRKVEAIIGNARLVCAMAERGVSLDGYLWGFVDGVPIDHRLMAQDEMPATTPLSEEMSRQMRRDGFRFMGPTVVYSLMQAAGLVNDHLLSCFAHGA